MSNWLKKLQEAKYSEVVRQLMHYIFLQNTVYNGFQIGHQYYELLRKTSAIS
jgi:hypothetical protein